MNNAILLLRLEAPMQSWGTRSRWDVRDSSAEPTKSGIIGLLGCALGVPRGDAELESLDRSLLFGVRADRPGVMASDYHTITDRHRMANGKLKPEPYTVVSPRDYLHDASFLVALAGERPLLERLTDAIQRPRWPLFLGRKSCPPSRPILDKLTEEYADLETALNREAWSAPTSSRKLKGVNTLTAWIEDVEGPQQRQDAVRCGDLRFYDFRRVRRLTIPVETLESLE